MTTEHAIQVRPLVGGHTHTLCGRDYGFHFSTSASTPTDWNLVTCKQCLKHIEELAPGDYQARKALARNPAHESEERVEKVFHEAIWDTANLSREIFRAVSDARDIVKLVLALEGEPPNGLVATCERWLEVNGR